MPRSSRPPIEGARKRTPRCMTGKGTDAQVLCQSELHVQRRRLPGEVRQGRARRIPRGRIPLPLCVRQGRARGARARRGGRGGAFQPARGRLGEGRSRHRLPTGAGLRVPRRRRPGDRIRPSAGLQAHQLPLRHRAASNGRDDAARDFRVEPALRGGRDGPRGHHAAGRAGEHAHGSGQLPAQHRAGARPHGRGARGERQAAVRHVSHADHGRRPREDHRGEHRAHRPHADRRRAGAP